jgi:hypothetical protein
VRHWVGREDLLVQPRMCGDCAFRKDSPERSTPFEEEALFALARSGLPPASDHRLMRGEDGRRRLADSTGEPSGACVVCGLRDPRWPQVCDLDRGKLAARLWELLDLWRLLPAAILPGQNAQQKVSGSSQEPAPLRIEPLDLAALADQATRSLYARGLLGLDDAQVGTLSVATVLQTRVLEWAGMLDLRPPAGEVPEMVSWLSRHLAWACNDYPEVADFAAEITTTLYACRAVLNVSRKPIYLDDPCPSCSHRALRRDPGGGEVECGHCRRTWPDSQFRRLAVVLAEPDEPPRERLVG